jgi:hypothetical protein
MNDFNGWANRRTWAIMLHLRNEQPRYDRYQEFLRTGDLSLERIKAFVLAEFPGGMTESSGDEIEDIHWGEIQESMRREVSQDIRGELFRLGVAEDHIDPQFVIWCDPSDEDPEVIFLWDNNFPPTSVDGRFLAQLESLSSPDPLATWQEIWDLANK